MQFKLTGGIDNGMSGIIATGKTDNYLSLFGQHVYHLTLPLIPPLSTNNNYDWHFITCY
jgi:hypothetical protein